MNDENNATITIDFVFVQFEIELNRSEYSSLIINKKNQSIYLDKCHY